MFDGVPELLLNGLREGRYGSSFRAKVVKEEFNPRPGRSEHNPLGLPESVVRELRLVDVGPCSLPAYPATTAQVRSVRAPEPTREAAKPYWYIDYEEPDPPWLLRPEKVRRHARAITPRPNWLLGKEDEPYWLLAELKEEHRGRSIVKR